MSNFNYDQNNILNIYKALSNAGAQDFHTVIIIENDSRNLPHCKFVMSRFKQTSDKSLNINIFVTKFKPSLAKWCKTNLLFWEKSRIWHLMFHLKTSESLSNIRSLVLRNDWISSWSLVISNVNGKLSLISVCITMYFLVILDYPGQGLSKVYGCQQGVHGGNCIKPIVNF